jgi:hypothetical protein
MAPHQELDELPSARLSPCWRAEAPHLALAELRVVAAAALGDVVKQRGDVEQVGAVELRRQLRAEGVLVGVLGDEEAPHIAQHHQDVLVHRVDVEQVVLHLPDDARGTATGSAPAPRSVHQAHGVGLPLGGAQDGQEGRAVAASARQRASISGRALYRARRVRLDRPLSPAWSA